MAKTLTSSKAVKTGNITKKNKPIKKKQHVTKKPNSNNNRNGTKQKSQTVKKVTIIKSKKLNPVDYPPMKRKFRKPTNCDYNVVKADKERLIQVMSYNILCDGLDTIQNHPHGTKEVLDFWFRAPRII